MIHETAVIGSDVRLGKNVSVGPYTVIEGKTTIGDDCTIGPHCHISGYTTIGKHVRIHKGAVVGDLPQDHVYEECESYCTVGDNVVIREYVTIHRGTALGSTTSIGDDCMLMGFVHIAHNCELEERVVVANDTLISGHVHVGRRAFISARVAIHQFVHVGKLAMVSGNLLLSQDVAPFCTAALDSYNESCIYGPNTVGLRRGNYSPQQRLGIKEIIKIYFFSKLTQADALAAIEEKYGTEEIGRDFIAFVQGSKRGLIGGIRK